VLLDQEDGELLLLTGTREHGEEIGHRRRRDPHFLALEQIAAVDLARAGGDGGKIAAGIRLGHADAADFFAAQRRREQALLDVGIAEHFEKFRAHQRLHDDAAGQRHRAARNLLQRQAERNQIEPEATAFRRIAQAEKAKRCDLAKKFARERVRLIDLGRPRRDALVAKARKGVADLDLLVAEIEIHFFNPSSASP
jgi:hypothetical protein